MRAFRPVQLHTRKSPLPGTYPGLLLSEPAGERICGKVVVQHTVFTGVSGVKEEVRSRDNKRARQGDR